MWLCWSWSLVIRHMNSVCSRVPIMFANLQQRVTTNHSCTQRGTHKGPASGAGTRKDKRVHAWNYAGLPCIPSGP